jgi:hypothetical protein
VKELLLAQERKDGKIHPEHKPDAIDWIFSVIGFLGGLPFGMSFAGKTRVFC